MGYIKIWVHLVWTTKNREPLLTDDIRKQVLDHTRENAIEKAFISTSFFCKYGFDKSISG